MLNLAVESPQLGSEKTPAFSALSAVATHDADAKEAVVFAVNRSATDALTLDAAVGSLNAQKVIEAITYTNKDPYWQATADDSTSVLPSENVSVKLDGGRLTAGLPPVSWTMIRLSLES